MYRTHNPQWAWTPLSGEGAARHGGRFNRKGVAALYTALSYETAIRENCPGGEAIQPMLLCAYEVDCEPVFDALDSKLRRAHGVTDAMLGEGWRSAMLSGHVAASQALADRLIAKGYAGIRVQSFALGAGEDDINLVLFRLRERRPSRVLLIDDKARLRRAGRRRGR